MNEITDQIHASNRRGVTNCGDTTPGRHQQNVERHPEEWSMITCPGCLATR